MCTHQIVASVPYLSIQPTQQSPTFGKTPCILLPQDLLGSSSVWWQTWHWCWSTWHYFLCQACFCIAMLYKNEVCRAVLLLSNKCLPLRSSSTESAQHRVSVQQFCTWAINLFHLMHACKCSFFFHRGDNVWWHGKVSGIYFHVARGSFRCTWKVFLSWECIPLFGMLMLFLHITKLNKFESRNKGGERPDTANQKTECNRIVWWRAKRGRGVRGWPAGRQCVSSGHTNVIFLRYSLCLQLISANRTLEQQLHPDCAQTPTSSWRLHWLLGPCLSLVVS